MILMWDTEYKLSQLNWRDITGTELDLLYCLRKDSKPLAYQFNTVK